MPYSETEKVKAPILKIVEPILDADNMTVDRKVYAAIIVGNRISEFGSTPSSALTATGITESIMNSECEELHFGLTQIEVPKDVIEKVCERAKAFYTQGMMGGRSAAK